MSSLANAEAYFAPTNHLRAASWARFDPDAKQGAITHANRFFSRLAGVADIEAYVKVDVKQGINPEYAVYEQALWMLSNLPVANADASFAMPEATDIKTTSKARQGQIAEISPDALRWMVPGGYVTLARG